MANFKTLDQADVKGKRVLLRVDLNVPTENGQVTDATRIERIAPTITEIADKGGKVILLAHFGRPKGPDPKESLEADRGGGGAHRQAACRLRRGLHRREGRGRGRCDEARRHPAAWRTPASTKARRRTTRRSSPRWPSSATSGSTTPSRPRTGRTPRPRGSATSSRPMPAAPCRPSWRRWRRRWTRRRSPSSPSSAAPRSRPSSSFWKICIARVEALVIGGAMANTFLHAQGIKVGKSLVEKDMAGHRPPHPGQGRRPALRRSSCRSTPSSRSTSRPTRPPMPMASMRSRPTA